MKTRFEQLLLTCKIIFLGIILIIPILSKGQDVLISAGGTKTQCGGYLYDSGGASGNYQGGESYTITICPTNGVVRADLLDIGLIKCLDNAGNVTGWDTLEVFDGNSVSAPKIGTLQVNTGSLNDGYVASVDNTTGCLTFRFTSFANRASGCEPGPGFKFKLSCVQPCQPVIANATITPAPDANGNIKICQGGSISVSANGIYPQNDRNPPTGYHQADATCTFKWDFGDSDTSVLASTTHTYTGISPYKIKLKITDQKGCTSTNDIGKMVMVSSTPIFSGTHPLNDTICPTETTQLIGVVTPVEVQKLVNLGTAGTTFLPDGSGVSYTSVLTFDAFANGQTLNNASDIEDICMNLEHTYLGDLRIEIICPNGQHDTLVQRMGTSIGKVHLGEPICCDNSGIPGVGFDYCFRQTCDSTMIQVAQRKGYRHAYTEIGTNKPVPRTTDCMEAQAPGGAPDIVFIPAGCYKPKQAFTSLVGCPLNGDWTIKITDLMASDNGYIFSWGMSFNPAIVPAGITYTPTILTQQWQGTDVSGSGSTGTASPTSSGIKTYDYVVTDDFGCTYDTTISVVVRNQGDPHCGCTFPLTATIVDATCANSNGSATPIPTGDPTTTYTYSWKNTQTNQIISGATLTNVPAGTYIVTGTSSIGCTSTYPFTINTSPIITAINFTTTNEFCDQSNGTATVQSMAGGTMPITSYSWSAGNSISTQTNGGLPQGSISCTITDSKGCTYTGSVNINETPGSNPTLTEVQPDHCEKGVGILKVNETYQSYNWSNGMTFQQINNLFSGFYSVSVTDVNGCVGQGSINLTNIPAPPADFTINPRYAFTGDNINFESILNSGIYSWTWNYGDGQNPVVGSSMASNAYQNTGTYGVQLTVSDAFGCTGIKVDSVTIVKGTSKI